jgi:hypothetical protein
VAPQVKGFKQTDASKNFKAFCFRLLARPVIVEQHGGIRAKLLSLRGAHFART